MAQAISPNNPNLLDTARPAANFAEAMERVTALQAKDGPEVYGDSHTRLWSHGAQTEHSVIFYHGYTNAPPQFKLLGEQFFNLGYNVLVPRLPYHGLEDRMTTEQAKLTAQDLVKMTQETIDIARGLGQKVTVSGLSAGGVMAAWAAQFRPDVYLAAVMGPALGLPFVPAWASTGFRNGVTHLPNMYIWWDPRVKDKIVGPSYAYPRWCTHSLAQVFRMGKQVRDAAATTPPAARHIAVITSAFDKAIHLPTAKKLADAWKAHGADVRTYEFASDLKVWHDMIDPEQPIQRVDIVYPVLIKLMTE